MEYQPSVERYDRMQYKNCGNSGLLLPRISLGLWHNFGSVDDFGIASDMIKYAFDNGVTHFDLANNYGPAWTIREHYYDTKKTYLIVFFSLLFGRVFSNLYICVCRN